MFEKSKMEERVKEGEEHYTSWEKVLTNERRIDELERKMAGVKAGLFWHDFDHKWAFWDNAMKVMGIVMFIAIGVWLGIMLTHAV